MKVVTKDSKIEVRAPKEDAERWFHAARLLAAKEGDASLSRHARRLLNEWADGVIRKLGAK